MSMAQHTPGPWTTNGNAIESADMHIADVADERYIPVEICEVRANANLIAAAPDLLSACNEWLAYMDSDGDEPFEDEGRLMSAMRAAVAKVKGE